MNFTDSLRHEQLQVMHYINIKIPGLLQYLHITGFTQKFLTTFYNFPGLL